MYKQKQIHTTNRVEEETMCKVLKQEIMIKTPTYLQFIVLLSPISCLIQKLCVKSIQSKKQMANANMSRAKKLCKKMTYIQNIVVYI